MNILIEFDNYNHLFKMINAEKVTETTTLSIKSNPESLNDSDIKVKVETKDKSEFEKRIINAYIKIQTSDKTSMKETEEILRSAYELLKSEIDKTEINKNIIDKLKRITQHDLLNLNLLIGKIYIVFINKKNITNENLLVSFINEILNVSDLLKKTSLSSRYDENLFLYLDDIVKKVKFPKEQKEIIDNILKENFAFLHPKKFGVKAFDEFIEMLLANVTKQQSLNQQYNLILNEKTELIELIRKVKEANSAVADSYVDFGKIIATLMFNKHCYVFVSKSEEGETLSSNRLFYDNQDIDSLDFLNDEEYSVLYDEIIEKDREKLIPIICEYVEHFMDILDTFDFQFVSYLLLKRVYLNHIIPKEDLDYSVCGEDEEIINTSQDKNKERVENILSTVLVNLLELKPNDEEDEDCKTFVKYLLSTKSNREKEMRRMLKEKLAERNIEIDQNIAPSFNPFYESTYILDSDLKFGFFQTVTIEAGDTYTVYVELEKECSFFTMIFTLQDNDINFTIYDITEREPKEIVKLEQVTVFETPIKYTFYSNKPKMYKLVFDNTYSWINSKVIKFNIDSFSPIAPFCIKQKISLITLESEINGRENHSTMSNHMNKIMLFKNKEKNRAFNCGNVLNNIQKFEAMIKENLIYFINVYVDKVNKKCYSDFNFENEFPLTKERFNDFIKKKLEQVKEVNYLFKVVNIFVINSDNSPSEPNSKINEKIFSLLGFYPKWDSDDSHITFLLCNYSEFSLIYGMYSKIISSEKIETIVNINVGKTLQISVFNEGEIFNNVEKELNLTEDVAKNADIIMKSLEKYKEHKIFINIHNLFKESSCALFEEISKVKGHDNVKVELITKESGEKFANYCIVFYFDE